MIRMQVHSGETFTVDPETCTVADMVKMDYRTAHIFKEAGIDFCCGGKKPITQTAVDKNLDPTALIAQIEALGPVDKPETDLTGWPPSLIIHYIEEMHHAYVRRALPVISQFAQKVARVHGESDPRLVKIYYAFTELGRAMLEHLESEEKKVFPGILASAKGKRVANEERDMVEDMESEHELVGGLMADIRNWSDDFTPPDWACNTYRVLFASLAEFERDLHRHVFIENHVLFPKWLKMGA